MSESMAAFDRAEFDELLREVVALREWKAAHEAAAFQAGSVGEPVDLRHEAACVRAVQDIALRFGLHIVHEASEIRPDAMSHVKPSELAERLPGLADAGAAGEAGAPEVAGCAPPLMCPFCGWPYGIGKPHAPDCKRLEVAEQLRAGASGGQDQDPGRCADCQKPFQWVRPGKSQATCDCWTRCHIHGLGAIQYHAEGEFGRVSGYFCAQCMAGEERPSGPPDSLRHVVEAYLSDKPYWPGGDSTRAIIWAAIERAWGAGEERPGGALQQIAAVNAWQARDDYHPLTCGNDSRHAILVPALDSSGGAILVCKDCTYVQHKIPDVVLEAGARMLRVAAGTEGSHE